ncbi:MAG TPA: glycosyltransferase family 4 protein [Candidatus Angelobacter sp.]|nr:glycosyltransferase family 4 protein [Candidatus Angelobacter sp.]
MHILVTCDTIGGVWTYTRELVTGLTRRGLTVTLVSFGDIPSWEQTQWMDGLQNLTYHPTAFKLEWMQESEADLAASSDYLESLTQEIKPDVLHSSQFYYGALNIDIPRLVVAHSDVLSWWGAVHKKEPPDSSWIRWYRRIVLRGLSHATAVVAPSHWMLEQIGRHYCKAALGSVIYNGRSPLLFNPHRGKDEMVVTVGRLWDGGKNTSLLLQKDMPLPVCVVGPQKHPESREEPAGLNRPTSDLQVQPPLNEKRLSQLLGRAAIYAATSRYEPFGLAPVEAALSRCAIVASDIPSFRELWEGAAVFFRNDDSQSLRSVLEQLVQDASLRRAYANLAYDRARQRFTADRMVEEYIGLYARLAPAARGLARVS